MIISALLNMIILILDKLLAFINLPGIPSESMARINEYVDMIFSYSRNLIGFFLPWNVVSVGIPIIILVMLADKIYNLVMWILRKIPMLGIG